MVIAKNYRQIQVKIVNKLGSSRSIIFIRIRSNFCKSHMHKLIQQKHIKNKIIQHKRHKYFSAKITGYITFNSLTSIQRAKKYQVIYRHTNSVMYTSPTCQKFFIKKIYIKSIKPGCVVQCVP